MPPLRSLCAPALAALLLLRAADASGTCQRLVPGTQMDGNGCGPADSAVGDACNTADDCFFGQTPGRCVCTPAGPPPARPPPPAGPPPPPVACVPPPPPPPRKIPLPCTDFFDINRHCPSHGLGHVVPASCDEVASCRGVFVSWYERCWFDRDLQMALEGAPGSRDELTGFYQACNIGGGGSGGPPPPAVAAGGGGGKPPPPPPPLSPDTCLDLSARAAELNVECCDEASEDCSSGQPVVCNVGCSAVVLPFFADCSGALGAATAAYTDLVEMCHYPTVNAHVISQFCTRVDPHSFRLTLSPKPLMSLGCNVNLETDHVMHSAEYTGPAPTAPATGARPLCVCALLAQWRLHEPERRFHVRLRQRFHWRSLRDGCTSATTAPRAHVRLEQSTRWWASLKSSRKLHEWPMHLWVLWQPLLWMLMISIRFD